MGPAKIALLGFDLRRAKMKMGVSITLENPEEINRIQEKEIDMTMERVQAILKAGANVVLTTKGRLEFPVQMYKIACRSLLCDARHPTFDACLSRLLVLPSQASMIRPSNTSATPRRSPAAV